MIVLFHTATTTIPTSTRPTTTTTTITICQTIALQLIVNLKLISFTIIVIHSIQEIVIEVANQYGFQHPDGEWGLEPGAWGAWSWGGQHGGSPATDEHPHQGEPRAQGCVHMQNKACVCVCVKLCVYFIQCQNVCMFDGLW